MLPLSSPSTALHRQPWFWRDEFHTDTRGQLAPRDEHFPFSPDFSSLNKLLQQTYERIIILVSPTLQGGAFAADKTAFCTQAAFSS